MELVLEQKTTQKMSAQMIQSMEILQMGALELREYVEEQILENPVLEREEDYAQEEGTQLLHRLEWLASGSRRSSVVREDSQWNAADAVADPEQESLYDHLGEQIPWQELSPVLCRGVECVLTGLNDYGWLEESVEELARRGGVSSRVITEAERIVRDTEPAGVGARTLSQCLELQLRRRGERGLALTIVQNHLEDMAKDHYHRISFATGADREEIQRACRQIRALNPRPGAAFASRSLPACILPDVTVTEVEGSLDVQSADRFLPELKLSSYYQQLLRDDPEEQVKSYLTEKMRQADWVIKNIEQRRNTMMRCARCIVNRQEEFFHRGVHFLKPLSLADVAVEVGVHESTVSRAVKDKYIQCAWGLFSMSELFGRALPTQDGDISARQVKAAIRSLINGENKKKPLSDQKLCDALEGQGMSISRRTVAKYRDEMGIPAAPGRKEF